jgi:TetR/AcrR family transcriptional repressor of nem operon
VNAPTTRDALMQAAEQLVRSRGFSAFSYADLAAAVGIRKASIHHHFPAKADLGVALVEDYIARFRDLLAAIEQDRPDSQDRLAAYAALYEASVRQGMLCLCGMLATETAILPAEMRGRIRIFFADQLAWLERVLAEGAAAGRLDPGGPPRRAAEHVLATLQGASLLAWGLGTPDLVARAAEDLLASLRR